MQSLPHDRFTKLIPFYEYQKRDPGSARENLMTGLGFDNFGDDVAICHMPHMTKYPEPFVGINFRHLNLQSTFSINFVFLNFRTTKTFEGQGQESCCLGNREETS